MGDAAEEHKLVRTQVLDLYHDLLMQWSYELSKDQLNPYQPVGRMALNGLKVAWWRRLFKSPAFRAFWKTSNVLPQELPCARWLLKRVLSFDQEMLHNIAVVNDINLQRLQRRVIIWNRIFAFLSAIVPLLVGLNNIGALPGFNGPQWMRDVFYFYWNHMWMYIFLLAFMFMLSWMHLYPKINMVKAFSDILKIAEAGTHLGRTPT